MRSNNITDVYYDGSNLRSLNVKFRLEGNPYCNDKEMAGWSVDKYRCFCQGSCYDDHADDNNKKVIIIAAAASAASAFVIIAIVVAALLYRAQKYKRYLLLQVSKKFEEFDVKPTIYSYNELKAATRDFYPDTKLGEGGYGAVYKLRIWWSVYIVVERRWQKQLVKSRSWRR